MIKLVLSGSTIASFTVGGGTHEVDVARGCVTCTAAREMLVLGVDPSEEINVRRDGKPAFAQIKTVGWWAARTVVEDSEQGPRIRLLTPTERRQSANSVARASDPPEDETPAYAPSIPGAGHGRT